MEVRTRTSVWCQLDQHRLHVPRCPWRYPSLPAASRRWKADRSRHSEGASDDAIDTGDDRVTGGASPTTTILVTSRPHPWMLPSLWSRYRTTLTGGLVLRPRSRPWRASMAGCLLSWPFRLRISKVGTRDFLSRLDPAQMVHPFGLDIETGGADIGSRCGREGVVTGACRARLEGADYAVVVSATDYNAAVIGSSIMALMAADDRCGCRHGGCRGQATALVLNCGIGVEAPPPELVGGMAVDGVDEVMAWVEERGRSIDYLAVTNVNDRASGRSQKASMVASMYTAIEADDPGAIEMPTDVVSTGATIRYCRSLRMCTPGLGRPPRHLAIVGAHDALPQMRKPTIFDNPLSGSLSRICPMERTDPFVDIAIGRIIGDTPEELSVIASRTAQ